MANPLGSYPTEFLDCRVQHNWQLKGFYRAAGRTVVKVDQCERCTSVRRLYWSSATGERVSNGDYKHAHGYKLSGVDLKAVRRELLKRTTVYASFDDLIDQAGPIQSNGRHA